MKGLSRVGGAVVSSGNRGPGKGTPEEEAREARARDHAKYGLKLDAEAFVKLAETMDQLNAIRGGIKFREIEVGDWKVELAWVDGGQKEKGYYVVETIFRNNIRPGATRAD